MRPFNYVRASSIGDALASGRTSNHSFLAGGTSLVDLMRLDVAQPSTVVDVGRLPLAEIEVRADGSVSLGALARNTEIAIHPVIVERFPVLAEAILSGASPQIRNVATTGGNLLQRTRCPYFRDVATPCNKRQPGSGCGALAGYSRNNAIFGTSDRCIATHPSDMCVALVALDAIVHVRGPDGERAVPIADFHVVPGAHPEVETVLGHGELVTRVDIPATPFARHSRYVKVRDRAAFAFALASTAVALELRGKQIAAARVALGGVATKPWRAREVEAAIVGKPVGLDTFQRASAALTGAHTTPDNAWKLELVRRTIVRALARAGGLA